MSRSLLTLCAATTILLASGAISAGQDESLWDLAQKNKDVLKVSTLFTAQNVRDHLSLEDGRDKAVDWCKKTGVTHVFLETFRSNYMAEEIILKRAKADFLDAGIDVSGCVTTTLRLASNRPGGT